MIEAVNSVISNAVLARGSAEQQSVARSFAANPDRVQEVARAPYVSPYISMNVDYNKAVLQIRNGDTGDVVRQFPSESQLEAYRKAEAAAKNSEALAQMRAKLNKSSPVATSPTSSTSSQPVQAQVQAPSPTVITTNGPAADAPAPSSSSTVRVDA